VPDYRTKKQKQRGRLFFYLTSGLKWNVGDRVAFYTMTTSPEADKPILTSWGNLVADARRVCPRTLIEAGYVDDKRAAYLYDLEDIEQKFKFEYAGCITNEGNDVIHALVAGQFLPVNWIRERWLKHHNTPQFKVVLIKAGNNPRLVKYLLEQYIAGQDLIARLVVSKRWIYPGCRADWLALVGECKTDLGDVAGYLAAREIWDNLMWKTKPADEMIRSLRNDRIITLCRRIHREKLNGTKNPDYFLGKSGELAIASWPQRPRASE
jgi:hypothetical protein